MVDVGWGLGEMEEGEGNFMMALYQGEGGGLSMTDLMGLAVEEEGITFLMDAVLVMEVEGAV